MATTLGSARRLIQELNNDVEGFVGVVDDEILLLDREKTIAAIVADALGKARIVGLELQLRPVETDEFGKIVQGQHSIEDKNFLFDDVEFLGDEARAAPRA